MSDKKKIDEPTKEPSGKEPMPKQHEGDPMPKQTPEGDRIRKGPEIREPGDDRIKIS
jgi:hypothetical protein